MCGLTTNVNNYFVVKYALMFKSLGVGFFWKEFYIFIQGIMYSIDHK